MCLFVNTLFFLLYVNTKCNKKYVSLHTQHFIHIRGVYSFYFITHIFMKKILLSVCAALSFSSGVFAGPKDPIVFEDKEVERVLLEHIDSNNDGQISYSEAEYINTIRNWFQGNTKIKKFNELKYFTSVSDVSSNAFENCTSLEEITFSDSGNFKYLNNKMFKGCSSLKSIVIPESVDRFFDQVFADCTSLESIKMPSKMLSIGFALFKNCTSLKSIVMPIVDNDWVGMGYFENCSSLETIVLPEGYTSIAFDALKGCSSLKNLSLPSTFCNFYTESMKYSPKIENITLDEGNTYYKMVDNVIYNNDMSHLVYYMPTKEDTSFDVPENVNIIYNHAFYNSQNLQKVKMPASLSLISNFAFGNSKALKYVDMSQVKFKEINDYTFENCTQLDSISMPESIVLIGEGAFKNCSNMADIKLYERIRSIEKDAFKGCKNLKNISFKTEGLELGKGAFQDCVKLDSIEMNVSTINFNDSVFVGCNDLRAIKISCSPNNTHQYENSYLLPIDENGNVTENNRILYVNKSSLDEYKNHPYYSKASKILKIKASTNKNVIEFEDPEVEKICTKNWDFDNDGFFTMEDAAMVSNLECAFKYNEVIKSFNELKYFTGLEILNESEFERCVNLESITLPEHLQILPSAFFTNCRNLKNVVLPDGLLLISDNAFFECNNLREISLPQTVQSIEFAAFSGTMIESFVLPRDLKRLDGNVFLGGEFLRNVTIDEGNNNFVKKDGVIYNSSMDQLVWYPPYLTNIEFAIEEGVTDINISAFTSNNIIRKITMPSTMKSAGILSFAMCSNLEEVVFNDQFEQLGEYAFAYDSALKKIILPESLTNIPAGAFGMCVNLSEIKISNNTEYIGETAFAYCYALKEFTLPASVKNIEEFAFAGDEINVINIYSEDGNITGKENSGIIPTNEDGEVMPDNNTIIYVPKGCKATYEADSYWSLAKEIREREDIPTGINNASKASTVLVNGIKFAAGTDGILNIYTADGMLYKSVAANSSVSLPKGIYIVNDKKMLVK